MQAWLALTRLYQGRWAEAGDAARPLVEQPQRGGHQPDHGAGGARAVAHATGRPGRGGRARRGARAGRAARRRSSAWGRCARPGRKRRGWRTTRERALAEARAAWDLAVHHRHPWHTGELGFWRWRAGERVRLPVVRRAPVRPPDRRRLAPGRRRVGARSAAPTSGPAPWPTATTRRSSPRWRSSTASAPGRISSACASACAPSGVRHIPRGPRPSTRGNPFGLTAREVEIAALLARGAHQRPDRRAAAHLAQDGRSPRLGHPGQARRRLARGSRPPGHHSSAWRPTTPAKMGRSSRQNRERLPMWPAAPAR